MRFLELFVSYWIEGFLIIGAGLSIMNIRLKLSKMTYIAILFSLVIIGVRKGYEICGIPYGTHSFIIVCLQIIILKYIGRQNWGVSVIAPLMTFFFINVGENIFMFNIINLLNITIEDILFKPGFMFLGTILSNIPLLILFIVGYIFKMHIIDINRFIEKEKIEI